MRMTLARRAVLTALVQHPERKTHSYELGKALGMGSGTLSPLLKGLWSEGLLLSEWEPGSEVKGRPLRRYYWLAPHQVGAVRTLLGIDPV